MRRFKSPGHARRFLAADGRDLTAEDVAFSVNRMIESGKPRPRVGLLRPYVESARALDRHTVRVRLHYPSPAFLQFFAVDYMKVVPKHIVEAGVDINVWENIGRWRNFCSP
jgi:ABC-type transport system substrate-binding protein